MCDRLTDTFYVALYDDATKLLSFPFFCKDGERRIVASRGIKESSGLAGQIIESRQTLYLPDESNVPAGLVMIRQPGIPTLSFIGVPLLLNDRSVGVLSMQSHSLNAYSPEQIETLELLATQVAIAIQNSQLYEQVQQELIERKRAQEALQVKDWAIESATNAIVTSDMEGNLNYINPTFLKLWGYSSPAEVLGKPVVGFWQMGEKAAEVMEAVRTKGSWVGELVAQDKDGAFFDVQAAASMVVNAAGQPVCIQASFTDITERKRLEQAVEKAHADFLFAVSHELKTPLLVLGATQEMIESLPEEQRLAKFREYGDFWRRNLMRLRFIIENLVDSQRPVKMGLKLEKRPANLLDLAQEIAAELESVASARSVQLLVQGESLPLLPMDRNAVRRLLENLLINAIKFSPVEGQVEIRLFADGEMLCLEVCDFGMGINPQIMPFLFRPFYRSPEALKAGVQGTSLGLYVAKLIAEAHDGSISLESEEGKWTTVTVRLPWKDGEMGTDFKSVPISPHFPPH